MVVSDSFKGPLRMLRDQLKEAMKQAMRDKDQRTLSTVRLILAAIKDRDIAARTEENNEADDNAIVLGILSKMVKQRQDSIKAYEEAGRAELAEQEREEIDVIQSFLPKQMNEDEIKDAVDGAIGETDASGLKDIGKVMAILKSQHAGTMDFGMASRLVKERLS